MADRQKLGLPKIDHGLLQDRVFDLLRERIASGELAPGTRLSTVLLAEELGVSRYPVSRALHQLAFEGYVSIHPRRGTTVAQFDSEYFFKALEMRLALEEFAAPLCVEQVTDDDVAQLAAWVRQVDDRFKDWETVFAEQAEFQKLGRAFHEQVIGLSRHVALIDTYRFVYDLFYRRGGDVTSARGRARWRWASTRRGPGDSAHHAVVEALRRRDPELLRQAFRTDVEQIRAETREIGLARPRPQPPTKGRPSEA